MLKAQHGRISNQTELIETKISNDGSHKDFLTECIKSKICRKGVQLSLEPTIGNVDQELVNGTPV